MPNDKQYSTWMHSVVGLSWGCLAEVVDSIRGDGEGGGQERVSKAR